MKLINLILLILFSNFTYCQTYQTGNVKKKCKEKFNVYGERLRTLQISDIDLSWSKIDNERITNLLDCMFDLSNSGDIKAKKMLLDISKRGWENLSEKSFSSYVNTYKIAGGILTKIGGKESFEIGLKYFSVNKSVADVIEGGILDYPNNHFGLSAFNTMLLPMMDEKSKLYYKKLYDNEFLEFMINDTSDGQSLNPFHSQIYPVIKKDWESGKIKLRKLTGDQ